MLIENFIRDARASGGNVRQLPRISCHLDDVTCERQDLRVLSIDNLSTEGMLLNYRGTLNTGTDSRSVSAFPGILVDWAFLRRLCTLSTTRFQDH